MIFSGKKTEGDNDVTGGHVTGELTFDQVDINIGEAFNGSSGIFVVPVSGIYKMTFSGCSAMQPGGYTYVHVYKNEKTVFKIYDENQAEESTLNNISFTWMMKVIQGDELQLKSMHLLYANPALPLTFTGELIHSEN